MRWWTFKGGKGREVLGVKLQIQTQKFLIAKDRSWFSHVTILCTKFSYFEFHG